jgi:hypothetical protein
MPLHLRKLLGCRGEDIAQTNRMNASELGTPDADRLIVGDDDVIPAEAYGEYGIYHREQVGFEKGLPDIDFTTFAIGEADTLECILDLKGYIYLGVIAAHEHVYLFYVRIFFEQIV